MQPPFIPGTKQIALLENAQENGVKIIRGAKVIGLSSSGDILVVNTVKGPIRTRFVVNSARVYADRVARMAGPIDWEMVPQTGGGASMITDKSLSAELASGENIVVFAPEPGYLEAFSPTLGGNLYFNCGKYKAIQNREGLAISRDELLLSISIPKRLVGAFTEKHIIKVFTGVCAYHTGKTAQHAEEHIVGPHPANHRFINAAFRLPPFNAAPAVAMYEIPKLLLDAGLCLVTKTNFNRYRKASPKFNRLTEDKKRELIQKAPRYGHLVCRCEHVTEAEIVEAIKRDARTVQDVRLMTGAGFGRCQAGFYGSHVVRILSRQLGMPATRIVERKADSPVILYDAKELLQDSSF